MIYRQLLRHFFQCKIRNFHYKGSLALKIVQAISLVYFSLVVFLSGFQCKELLNLFLPGADPVAELYSFLIYYFSAGLLFQYIFQSSGPLEIRPYLLWPVNRNRLIFYNLCLYPFGFFNILSLIFLVPFGVINIWIPLNGYTFLRFLGAVMLLLLITGYLTLLLKNFTRYATSALMLPWLPILMLLIGKYIFHFSPGLDFGTFLNTLIAGKPGYFAVLILIAVLLFFADWLFMKSILYMYEYKSHTKTAFPDHPSLFQPGRQLIQYFMLECRLLARNTAPRRSLLIGLILILFVGYMLFQNTLDSSGFLFTKYILVTGLWGYLLGQYAFSWEGGYFDLLNTLRLDVMKYIQAKYLLYVVAGIGIFLPLLILSLLLHKNTGVLGTAMLFNAGFGYFIILWAATFNRERIPLDDLSLFHPRGFTPALLLGASILLTLPYALNSMLHLFFPRWASLLIIDLLSLVSLLYRRKWFGIIVHSMVKQKHGNLEGFRK